LLPRAIMPAASALLRPEQLAGAADAERRPSP